jgi:hypothetical protein
MKASKFVVGLLLLVALLLTALSGPRIRARAATDNTHRKNKASDQQRDRFGGIQVPLAKGTGFFRVLKYNYRWVFVTPEGHPFWLRAVYNTVGAAILSSTIQSKYGGDSNLWANHRNRRILSWGFNALGEYASTRGLPVGVYGGRNGNSSQLPFILMLGAAGDAMNNWRLLNLPRPLKDIMRSVPKSAYNGWRASFPDVFDPNYPTACANAVAYWSEAITGGFADKPWVIGITLDDADYLFGFKSRPGAPINSYPHNGWLIAVANFRSSSAEDLHGQKPSNSKLYTKYAWTDFLRQEYDNDIGALNQAWHTNGFYTSFDDVGGYGVGTGVVDEDGRHTAWMGSMADPYKHTGAAPAVQANLDSFLYRYTKRYTQVAVDAIRAVDKNHLIFGPAAINNFGAKARDQVLLGLRDGGVQVFQFNYDPAFGPMAASMAENNQSYDLTGIPAYIWYSVTAQADSAMAAKPTIYAQPNFPTQAGRGDHYANVDVPNFFKARGANGDHYVTGFDWWELVDNPGEGINWGLITLRDNAYDGKEAVIAPGTDPEGFSVGGENANYGDFISFVRTANFGVDETLSRELSNPAEPIH